MAIAQSDEISDRAFNNESSLSRSLPSKLTIDDNKNRGPQLLHTAPKNETLDEVSRFVRLDNANKNDIVERYH